MVHRPSLACVPRVVNALTAGFSLLALACDSRTEFPLVDSVAFDTVAVLDFDTLHAPTWGAAVGVSPDASIIVVSPADRAGELYFFGGSGRLARTVGRPGGGPSEFARVSNIAVRDRVYVSDAGNSRISVLSLDGEFLEPMPLQPLERLAAASSSGDLVLRSRAGSSGVAVRMTEGNRIPYLAPDDAVPEGEEDAYAHFAASRDGGVWVSGLRHYSLRRYSAEGVQVAQYRFTPDWFMVTPRNAERYADWLDSRSVVAGISEDAEAGLLWVKLGIPEAEYPNVDIDPGRIDRSTLDLFADDVVEGVDVRDGRVRAHRRFPYQGLTLLPDGYGWLHGEREDGEPQLVVIRLRATRS